MKVFNWNKNKNQQLILERRVSFEEAIFYIENGYILDDIIHPNKQTYPNQKFYIVQIIDYIYLVSYVENDHEIFLKTIIPSSKFTKIYLGE